MFQFYFQPSLTRGRRHCRVLFITFINKVENVASKAVVREIVNTISILVKEELKPIYYNKYIII